MARNDPQINLRLPITLKEQIEDAAATNNRTITAEVVARLQGSFAPNLLSMAWPDLIETLQREAAQRGATVTITLGK